MRPKAAGSVIDQCRGEKREATMSHVLNRTTFNFVKATCRCGYLPIPQAPALTHIPARNDHLKGRERGARTVRMRAPRPHRRPRTQGKADNSGKSGHGWTPGREAANSALAGSTKGSVLKSPMGVLPATGSAGADAMRVCGGGTVRWVTCAPVR